MPKKRCWGISDDDQLMAEYHDNEWGKPVHDDRHLFEIFILDGAQAGLSWSTILNKRENYRKAFDNFNVKKVASYNDKKIKELMNNAGIVRNKLKIASAIRNAKVFIEIQKEFGSFDKYIWGFVNGKPVVNKWKKTADIPSTAPLSDEISKDLKKRGMNFVGSTIVYAIMQGMGLVNDHGADCHKSW